MSDQIVSACASTRSLLPHGSGCHLPTKELARVPGMASCRGGVAPEVPSKLYAVRLQGRLGIAEAPAVTCRVRRVTGTAAEDEASVAPQSLITRWHRTEVTTIVARSDIVYSPENRLSRTSVSVWLRGRFRWRGGTFGRLAATSILRHYCDK
jgi:hypothetical protein